MVLDEGSLWQSMATKTRTADFGSTSDPAAARSENPTKRGRGTGLQEAYTSLTHINNRPAPVSGKWTEVQEKWTTVQGA
jgi:hypothetical protein